MNNGTRTRARIDREKLTAEFDERLFVGLTQAEQDVMGGDGAMDDSGARMEVIHGRQNRTQDRPNNQLRKPRRIDGTQNVAGRPWAVDGEEKRVREREDGKR